MVVRAISTKEYVYEAKAESEGEESTFFHIKPLGNFEAFNLGKIMQSAFGSMGNLEDKTDEEKEEAVDKIDFSAFEICGQNFIKKHIKRIRNFEVDGELKDIAGDEIDPESIPIEALIAIMSDAIERVALTKEEAKN